MTREQAGGWVVRDGGSSVRLYASGCPAAHAMRDGGWAVGGPDGFPIRHGRAPESDGTEPVLLAREACDDALRAAGHLPPLRRSGRPPERDAPATKALRVRVTPGEHEAVRAAADAAGVTVSEYVRGRVL